MELFLPQESMTRTAHEVLRETFGFEQFRPHQEEIIATVVSGRDSFVLMPTGGGKSLCFQVPALLFPGTTLVVSPLIALMKDQVDALQANGVRAECYNSSLSGDDARRVLAQFHAGELDMLYVAPERMMSASFIARLETIDIALLAIDEAHCVSQWGHDFRPEYAELGRLRELLPRMPIVALTATADAQTRDDVLLQLRLRDPKVFVTGFDRPNIRYTVTDKSSPIPQLLRFMEKWPGESGIVYALSRKRVEQVAKKLQAAGINAAPYHAGLPPGQRQKAHEDFVRDKVTVIVATVAFGMGIDKPDIRFVAHFDIPKNIEGYYQETGRAGRDGLPAEAFLLLGYQDVVTARVLVENTRDATQKRIELHKLNSMIAYAEALTCRRQVLLGYFGDMLEEGCGNCDLCLHPPEHFDGTVEAQKALSCVYRLNQRFGLKYVVDVLRGARTQRLLRLGHDQLSTYGIGKERSEAEWTSIFRQLIHRGYLFQDIENYSVLRLTESSRALLLGNVEVQLAKPKASLTGTKGGSKKKRSRKAVVVADLPAAGQELFENLRNLRADLAKAKGVPPYVVFGDKSLKHMAMERPQTDEQFLAIHGVGKNKLKKFGATFMEAIRVFEVGS